MTWLNWSLKLHSRLRIIPHLIRTHTTHMPNVQWMSYSFVWLYLFKCDVCVLNYIWINLKRFLIIYMYLEVIFITLCGHVWCLLYFSLCKHVLCWKTSVRVFRDLQKFSRLILRLASHAMQVACSSRSFCDSLATHLRLTKIFATHFATHPVVKRPKIIF